MKKKLILLWSITVFAVASAFTQTSQTVHVTTPGTLSTLIDPDIRWQIRHLEVTGTIDSVDIIFLSFYMSVLETLDLGGSEVVGNRIPELAFYFMQNMTEFVAPPTVTAIGQAAFFSCNHLVSVTLPSSLITIEASAFISCTSLAEITLPPTLQNIGDGAFAGSSLLEITIPASVKTLGGAFAGCLKMTSFHVEEENPYFCSYEGVLFNKEKTILYSYPAAHERTDYVIPASVATVFYGAFGSCLNLITVSIPLSVKSLLDSNPLGGCLNLSSILVAEENTAYSDIDGVLFNKDKTRLITFPSNKANSYVIPDGVTEIGDLAFSNNSKITSVTFNEELKSIGQYSFSNCKALTSPQLPSSLISLKLGAFSNCINFKSFILPPSLDSIPVDVITSCSSLVSMTIPSTVTFMSYTNLNRCTSLDSVKINASNPIYVGSFVDYYSIDTTNCTIYVPSGSLDAYRNAPFWRAFDIEEFDFSLLTSGNEFAVDATAGSETSFVITSNTEWSLSASQNWLHMDRLLGIDSDTIVISADANHSGNAREATVTVTGLGTNPVTITVTQAAGPTAIKHNDDPGIRVYPNPVTDKLYIAGCAGVRAEIYTLNGSLVLSKKLVQDTETIDMQSLAAGTYLVILGGHQYKISK